MVDAPRPQPSPPEKPFALRATLYTVGFLAVVLGFIPSIFWMIDRGASGHWAGFWAEASIFWNALRGLVGTTIFASGLIAYLGCSAWLIFHGRGPHVEFDAPKVFVATGPYRWVRNPVVITLIITVFGEAISFSSWGILALAVLGIGFAHYQVTRIEEPKLKERFGDSYTQYCERVPRWIPRPPNDD